MGLQNASMAHVMLDYSQSERSVVLGRVPQTELQACICKSFEDPGKLGKSDDLLRALEAKTTLHSLAI